MAEVVDDPLPVELLGGGQGRGEGGQQHQAARLHAEGGGGVWNCYYLFIYLMITS